MVNKRLSDAKAQNISTHCGNSLPTMLKWVRGTSKSNHDTPEEVDLHNFDIDEATGEYWIETAWYRGTFAVSKRGDKLVPVLLRIQDRVWGYELYPESIIDDFTLPIDEIAVEALLQNGRDAYREFFTPLDEPNSISPETTTPDMDTDSHERATG